MRYQVYLLAVLSSSAFAEHSGPARRPETPQRVIQESKTEDGIAVEFVSLTKAGDFFEGVCAERGNPSIVGLQVTTPFTSVKKSVEGLVEDLRIAGVLKSAKPIKVSRGYIGPKFRPEDGSYNGTGPETVCLQLDGEKAKDVCDRFRVIADRFGFGFKYSGCLSNEGVFVQSTAALKDLQQIAQTHNASSDFASAIIQFASGRFDEAKKLIEENGLSIPARQRLSKGLLTIPTGIDKAAEFAKKCKALVEVPNSPITACEANNVMAPF